jgi:thioredoxin reductase (NADPH)
METLYTIAIFVVLVLAVALPYWLRHARRQGEAAKKLEKSVKSGLIAPVTLHPQFDLTNCIGCAGCVRTCPEDVLGIVNGRPAIISGMKCIGHGLCAEACPVGAITLGFGTPRQGQEIPYYDDNHETNVPGLYIIGELGGMGLVKNAVSQGLKAVEHVARRKDMHTPEGYDVVIVGAGPAGMAAALACKAKNLKYVVLEQDEIGGTILHYPRQKLVLTAPVELPLYGRLKVSEIEKEELLGIWFEIVRKFQLNILIHHKVESISKAQNTFAVISKGATFHAANVMLALGRRGSPRKLGVSGEHLTKVMYRLIEAESYKNKHLLVVGGGDSAVEAAVGLARQRGNTVVISYRREDFMRLKDKNEKNVKEMIAAGKVRVIFNSNVLEIKPDSVIVQESEKIIHNIPNEFVFVFAGGELPTELLKRAGVKLRTSEVEAEAVAA